MIAQTTDQLEPIALWLDSHDVPARIVSRGIRYQVTDTLTPLVEDVPDVDLTHPARHVTGWQFQATSCDSCQTSTPPRRLARDAATVTGVASTRDDGCRMSRRHTPTEVTASSSTAATGARATAGTTGMPNSISAIVSSAASTTIATTATSFRDLHVARAPAHASDQAAELGASGIWKVHVVSCTGEPFLGACFLDRGGGELVELLAGDLLAPAGARHCHHHQVADRGVAEVHAARHVAGGHLRGEAEPAVAGGRSAPLIVVDGVLPSHLAAAARIFAATSLEPGTFPSCSLITEDPRVNIAERL